MRRIPASVVEDQVLMATQLEPDSVTSAGGTPYPHEFRNDEQLDLRTLQPRLEFPILAHPHFRDQDKTGPRAGRLFCTIRGQES